MANQGRSCRYVYTLTTHLTHRNKKNIQMRFSIPIGKRGPVKLFLFNYVLVQVLECFCFVFVWCPCMAINVVSVQRYGGFLPILYC